MTEILLKDIAQKMDVLDTSVSDIQITVGSVQDEISLLINDIRVIQKFNDKVETMIGNTVMTANNTIESMESIMTIAGVLLVLGGLVLSFVIPAKTKKEVISLIDEQFEESKNFTNHIDKYFDSEKFKELVRKEISKKDSTSINDTSPKDELNQD